MGDMRKTLRDYGLTVLIAAAVALVIRVLLIEAYRIPTAVMRPTLQPGDLIFASKWPYGIRIGGSDLTTGSLPEPTDVVIYHDRGLDGTGSRKLIKRVIGVPGDTIQVIGGRVVLNGTELPFESEGSSVCGKETHPGGEYDVCLEPPLADDFGPVTVPEGHVFVLADLRSASKQGPPYGLVTAERIVARAEVVWLSVDPDNTRDFGLLPRIRTERILHGVN